MPDIVIPVGDTTAPRYRYYTADLVTNTIIGELSLEDVNYERSLKNPGSFDGKITITDQTNALDLYNATMPGKTAIYAVRDGVCVWGGIIWGRTYDMIGRSLSFSASEFTSYLNHRMIWKAYSQTFTAKVIKVGKGAKVLVQSTSRTLLEAPIGGTNGEKVRISFLTGSLRKYTGNYRVLNIADDDAPADPGQNSFYVDIKGLPIPPTGSYPNVTVTMKVDTYEFLRNLIDNTLNDFQYVQFPNEEITPGIRVPITVTKKELVTTDEDNGIATLTTDTPHGLIAGQRIEISNVDDLLNGRYLVSEIPSPTKITYVISNPVSNFDKRSPITLTNIAANTSVSIQKTPVQYRQITKYSEEYITHLTRTAGLVELTLNSAHRFSVGEKVIVAIEGKKPALQTENNKDVNSFDYEKYNNTVQITDITSRSIFFIDPDPSHADAKYNRKKQSVQTPEKNIVKNAAEKTLLKVFPAGANHGYNIGEQLKIVNVDGYASKWSEPIFDGYAEVYDVSPGDSYTINYYEVVVDPDIEDATSYQTDTLVYLYFDMTDPKFKAGDEVFLEGLTTSTSSDDISALNGYFRIEEDSQPSASHGNRYYIYFRMLFEPTSYRGVTAGGIASVNGKSWLSYEPAYSEIKYSVTLKEPDAVSSIVKISYKADAGASTNRMTVNTTTRHNLNPGDFVSVKYSKEEDQNNYGADYVKVFTVQDINTFTYIVPKNSKSTEKDPIPPKKDTEGFVAKSGIVTRIKSVVGAPQPVSIDFSHADGKNVNEGGQVTLYSVDHGLAVGDFIFVDMHGSKNSDLENDRKSVKITQTTADTISYKISNAIPQTDSMEIRGILFDTDTDGQKVVAFDIVEKGTAVAAKTNTITKIKPKWHKGAANNNYVTYTTSAPTTFVVGDKVTITGLQDSGSITTSTTTATPSITGFSYFAGSAFGEFSGIQKQPGKTMSITFASNHGLPVDSGFSDSKPPTNKNTIKISGFLTKHPIRKLGWGVFSKISTVNLYLPLNNREIKVSKVPSSTSVIIQFTNFSPNYNFFDDSNGDGLSSVVYNKNKVTNTYKNFEQFNRTGTVDYVSGSTFSVKYDFLSGKSGNGVASDDAIGTEYTLSTTGTAKVPSYNKSNITAGSKINVLGVQDFTSTTTKKVLKFSKLNGPHTVKKTTSNSNYSDGKTSTRVYVVNKLKTADGKSTLVLNNLPYPGFDASYTDATYPSLSKAKIEKWQSTSGTARIDFTFGGANKEVQEISGVFRSSSAPTVAIFTSEGHDFKVGDFAEVNIFGKYSAAFEQGGLAREITAVTEDTFSYVMRAPVNISYYSISDDVATLFFAGNSSHNLVGGDVVTVSGITASVNGSRTITNTGVSSISFSVAAGTSDVKKTRNNGTISVTSYVNFNGPSYDGYAVPGAFIQRIPSIFSRTFGEFPLNADIGLSYSTNEYSGNAIQNTPITGSSLNTVASILDKYSSGIGGFEYRVDCNLTYDTQGNKNFTRTFVLIPIYPDSMTQYLNSLPGNKLAVGQWAPPAAFGADKVIFEYPGNITNVNMTESAQNSATRMFVSSSSNGSGVAEVPYSAASDTVLLAAGWPLLDKKETVSYPQSNAPDNKNIDEYGNYDMETDFYTSASRFLSESKPPQGDITISVNGSLTPAVGSYDPGDWCSIIINDDFIKNRLNSPLEPRKDVIVRKIDAIKVSVPNNPAFPEMIDLTLIPDWQVDTIGR
jgi:hypothetical protein